MDKTEFRAIAERLTEINEVLAKLDPTIRAAAFDLLEPYALGGSKEVAARPAAKSAVAKKQREPSSKHGEETGLEELEDELRNFLEGKNTKLPSDNVQAITAFLYDNYGTSVFSLQDIRTLADIVGLTIPERVDMTLRASQKNGKALFASAGRGKFRISVSGEAALKEMYGVTKGTSKRG